jgi:parallel beta-helix repeat protein
MSRQPTLAAAALFLAHAASAPAAVIVVPDERPSIRAALASARAGDTIRVRPGTYAESVVVAGSEKARLTLEGLGGRPLVMPPAGRDGIRVERAPKVTIHGFAVTGGAIGVHVLDASATQVSDVRIVGSGEGVRIRRCRDGCQVGNNTVEGTTRGPGIRIRDSPDVTVEGNVVLTSWRDGIRIARSTDLSFSDNRVEGSGADGVRITDCDRVQELEDNVASGNHGSGLSLDRGFVDGSCPACGVEDNTTLANGRYGVRVRRWARISSPADLIAFDNTASGNRNADFHVRP